jgi:hypothetical protein
MSSRTPSFLVLESDHAIDLVHESLSTSLHDFAAFMPNRLDRESCQVINDLLVAIPRAGLRRKLTGLRDVAACGNGSRERSREPAV